MATREQVSDSLKIEFLILILGVRENIDLHE